MEKPNERKETRYTSIYKQLRFYIMENNLHPGDVLPSEQTLCQKYGVSRNVLREALKGLSTIGVLEGRPGIGNVIRPFSMEDIVDNVLFCTALAQHDIIVPLLDIRKKLELAYMKEAYATLTQADIVKLRSLLDKMREKQAQKLYCHAEDCDFHMTLFSHIENAALQAIFSSIWAIDASLQIAKKIEQSSPQTLLKHENIVLALEEHQQDAFEAAMMLHFFSGKFASTRSSVQTITFEEY